MRPMPLWTDSSTKKSPFGPALHTDHISFEKLPTTSVTPPSFFVSPNATPIAPRARPSSPTAIPASIAMSLNFGTPFTVSTFRKRLFGDVSFATTRSGRPSPSTSRTATPSALPSGLTRPASFVISRNFPPPRPL